MPLSNKTLKVVSLFAGIGGFEVGICDSKINAEVVFASEIDKNASISYKANFPNVKLVGDITQIDAQIIPDHDLLCAGFPCQAFSIAGQMKGFDDIRGTLFFDVVRILKHKQPKYIILENVKNLISHDNGRTFDTIVKNLSSLGYTIDFSVINAVESGLPQNRDRTYIVGIRNLKVKPFEPDKRSNKISVIKQKLNNAISSFNFFNEITFNAKQKYIKDFIISNADSRYYYNTPKINIFLKSYKPSLESNMSEPKIIKLFDLPREVHNDLERQRRVYSINGISPTILARTDAPKILIDNGDSLAIRKFTEKECFLMQGFRNNFIDNIAQTGMSMGQMYRQAGNAVAPPIIAEIINSLFGEFHD